MSHLDPADPKRKASRVSVERISDDFGTRVRVMSQCEVLERRGTLTARQARAGTRIYQCWALGIMGARDADATGTGSDPGGYTDAQLDAARLYREIQIHVGRLFPLTFAVCCEDFSPARWANERGHGTHKAAAVALLRHALDQAADLLGD